MTPEKQYSRPLCVKHITSFLLDEVQILYLNLLDIIVDFLDILLYIHYLVILIFSLPMLHYSQITYSQYWMFVRTSIKSLRLK